MNWWLLSLQMQDINNAIMQLLQTQQKMRAVEDNRVRNQMRARIVAQFRKDVQQFLTVNQEVFSIVDDPKERCAALTDQVRNGVIDAYAARDLVNSLSVSDSNLWNWDADRFLASGAPPDAASFVRSMNSCAAGSFRLLLKDDYELCKREYHAALLHSVVIGGQIPDDMGVIPEEMRGDAERVLRLKSIAERTMPCVVVCGLLKAGKSSLLNSLMDRDGCFAEGITRKTTRNQEETWNGMLVIDTPGIDANRQDTEEAMKAYRDADLLLFVHSADSELTRQDMDLLGSLRDEHGDLAGRLIAVLANRDIPPSENILLALEDKVRRQISLLQKGIPVFSVSSRRYRSPNPILRARSGIDELRNHILAWKANGVAEVREAWKKAADDAHQDLKGAARRFLADVERRRADLVSCQEGAYGIFKPIIEQACQHYGQGITG